MCKGSNVYMTSTTLAMFCVLFVFITANLIGVRWDLIVLICISLLMRDVDLLSIHLLASYVFFGEMSIQAFSSFLTEPFVSKLKEFLYILHACCYLVSRVWLFCDPKDCNLPGSSVHGFPRQGYWSGLPFPSPGDEGSNLNFLHSVFPTLQVDSLPLSHGRSPVFFILLLFSH